MKAVTETSLNQHAGSCEGAEIAFPTSAALAPRTAPARALRRIAFIRAWLKPLPLLLFVTAGIFILMTFKQHGISNDEEVQHHYGRLLLRFYTSGFSDRSAFDYLNLYLYGGLFDVIAASLEPWVPLPLWDLRHLLSAVFGLGGLVATWKLARLLAQETTGLVAVMLLVLTGAWFGAIFTHTKDIPFATCMAWALYYTTRIAQHLPRPPRPLVIKLGIAIGLALGLRVGAVFAVFYLVVLVIATALWARPPGYGKVRFLWHAMAALLPAGGIAFILMGFFWPWSVMGPTHLIAAATTFSHFTMDLHLKTLFDGAVIDVGDTPRAYLPMYLWLRLPHIMLLGLAFVVIAAMCGSFQWRRALGGERGLIWIPVVLAATVPLAYALITAPALYNGMRHFLFMVPALAVLGAVGFRWAWREALRWRYGSAAFVALSTVLALDTATVLVRLHPYQYVFYNRFAGDFSVVPHRWELDYWSSSLREAPSMLNDYVKTQRLSKTSRFQVAVCAETIQASTYLGPAFQVTRDWSQADFFLFSTQLGCEKALPGPTIGVVRRLGTPLTIIRDLRAVPPSRRLH